MKPTITIGGRKIGPGEPPYIIAEMSGNHNGELERAIKLVHAARDAGADAVKLQTYTADTITIDHDGPEFTIKGGLWDGRTLYDLYHEAHTPWEWQPRLKAEADKLGLHLFSSPFDPTAVDFLEEMDVPAYKVASFEIVDIPLIKKIAATGKPMIMSTGMANLGEIQEAVNAARDAGCNELALLHCVSGYPAPAEEYNLRTIAHMSEAFGVVAGLSDHTLGTAVPTAAVALGADVVEKHFTLARADGGPDAAFSLEPDEFKLMVEACRTAFEAKGAVNYSRTGAESGNVQFRRSLYVVREVKAGETFTSENVRSIRPGFGLAPRHLSEILGCRAKTNISRGEPLSWEHLR